MISAVYFLFQHFLIALSFFAQEVGTVSRMKRMYTTAIVLNRTPSRILWRTQYIVSLGNILNNLVVLLLESSHLNNTTQ